MSLKGGTLFWLCMTLLFINPLYAANKNVDVEPTAVKTQDTVVVNGTTVNYTATAGTIILHDASQQPIASVFYVAYVRNGDKAADGRPITFAYNGGPGGSSAHVDIGGFGPRRVIVPSDATSSSSPPYKIVNNPYSILDKSDVVFIDPVGTGYSHALGRATGAQFWGIDEDIHSLGAFISDYISQHKRWNAPKYLLGESYGTFRTAALVNYLQDQGIYVNGIILLSSVLNFEASVFKSGNDLPYVLYLPSYAATAWYHHVLQPQPKDLNTFLAEVESFAAHEYMSALFQGDKLNAAEKEDVAKKLSKYTGLSESYWLRANLRVTADEYEKALLINKGLIIGRLDTRYINYALSPLSASREYKVMHAATMGAITTAMNHYLADVLHYKTNKKYIMAHHLGGRWDWKHTPPYKEGESDNGRIRIDTVVPDLRRALVVNPNLRVMVNSGYFDLGTPYYATEYSINELELPPSLQDHVHIYHYKVGHMIYLNTEALAAFHRNYDKFMNESNPQNK